MRIVFPMLIMLITGLAIGSGGMTLYWSGVADRGFKREAEYSEIAKQFEALARENLATSQKTTESLEWCLTRINSR